MPQKRRPMTERFWEKVNKLPGEDACWEWTGHGDRDGYGRLKNEDRPRGKSVRAHRYSWIIANGPIPNGMGVLHDCDNPACVRPSHLKLGTAADNQRDKSVRRRGRVSRRGMPYGVTPNRRRFQAWGWDGSRRIHLGMFKTIGEAAAVAHRHRDERYGAGGTQ
jgi:hypothetical protein